VSGASFLDSQIWDHLQGASVVPTAPPAVRGGRVLQAVPDAAVPPVPAGAATHPEKNSTPRPLDPGRGA
jgi:hypothetical protein